jgi:predicted Holliday junction resolvase-like endonuclease
MRSIIVRNGIMTILIVFLMSFNIGAQTPCIQIKAIDIQEDASKKESIERQNRRKLLVIEATKEKNRRKSEVDEDIESKIAALRKEMIRRKQVIDDEYCD